MHIYQYTDLNAVKNIVKTRKLWATHYRYLNDDSEILQGIDFLIDSISKEKDLSDDECKSLKIKVQSRLGALNIFVSSLCLAKDELTMWRAYGKYAVVFDKNLVTLGLTVDGSFRQNSVFPCLYPDSFKNINLNDCFFSLLHSYDRFYLGGKEDWFISSLVYNAASIKHYGFYSEKEHRAVISLDSSDSTNIFYRVRNEEKIPYIETLLPEGSINGIYVGPDKEQDKLVYEIQCFLDENKIKDLEIYTSTIPFKGN